MNSPPEEIRFFVSYSHLDHDWFEKLRPLLKFNDPITIAHFWHDRELKASDDWNKAIYGELQRMDVFLCLVSSYFFSSDYIREVEMTTALVRAKAGVTRIVPLFIDDMNPRDITDLEGFTPLLPRGRWWRFYEVNGGHARDAHKEIRTGLYNVIDTVKKQRKDKGTLECSAVTEETPKTSSSTQPPLVAPVIPIPHQTESNP